MPIRTTPNVAILFEGADITSKLLDRLLSVTTEHDQTATNDSAQMIFDDRDNGVPMAPAGANVQFFFGYVEDDSLIDQGTYQVDENERSMPPRQLLVHCKVQSLANSKLKNVADDSYHGKSLKDIIVDLGQKGGLTGIVHPDLANIQIPHWDRTSQSVMAAADHIANTFGGVMKFGPGTMTVAPLGATTTINGDPIGNVSIDIKDCKSYKHLKHGRSVYDSHSSLWHDTDTGMTMRSIIGDIDGQSQHSTPEIASTKDEADGQAAAAKAETDGNQETFSFVVPGIPELKIGVIVTATSFPSDMPTEWRVVNCKQHFDVSNYETTCQCYLNTANVSSLLSQSQSVPVQPPGSESGDSQQDGQSSDITTQGYNGDQ